MIVQEVTCCSSEDSLGLLSGLQCFHVTFLYRLNSIDMIPKKKKVPTLDNQKSGKSSQAAVGCIMQWK